MVIYHGRIRKQITLKQTSKILTKVDLLNILDFHHRLRSNLPHLGEQSLSLLILITKADSHGQIFSTAHTKPGWWFQTSWKNARQNGNLPHIGVKIENIIKDHHIWKCFNKNSRNNVNLKKKDSTSMLLVAPLYLGLPPFPVIVATKVLYESPTPKTSIHPCVDHYWEFPVNWFVPQFPPHQGHHENHEAYTTDIYLQ